MADDTRTLIEMVGGPRKITMLSELDSLVLRRKECRAGLLSGPVRCAGATGY